jgi:hypothetical protein
MPAKAGIQYTKALKKIEASMTAGSSAVADDDSQKKLRIKL